MKYLSLFSGIGTGEKGIEQAYERCGVHQRQIQTESANVGSSSRIGIDLLQKPICCGFAEIDRHAEAIYKYHWPDARNYGDATRIVCDELPDFDFLIAGFPCQAFSIAGKRQGFDDARGTLFFEIARILSHKRPAHFLLENVAGLASHDSGKTQQRIFEILSSLGYFVERPLLNSKDYGVPQNRERVFFIGHLAGECEREILFVGDGDEYAPEQDGQRNDVAHTITNDDKARGSYVIASTPDIAYALDANYHKGCNDITKERRTVDNGARKVTSGMLQMEETKGNSQGGRVYHTEGISSGLKSLGGGGSAKCPMVTRAPIKYPGRNGKKVDGEYSFAVDTVNTGGVSIDSRIRRLTPVECERLQGLPDGWTEFGLVTRDLISYKECGNIEVWKNLKKIKNHNVQFQIVTENKKPIAASVSCTISDGNATELQNFYSAFSEKISSVDIVITKSASPEQWECVTSITRCDGSMAIRSTWKRSGNGQVEMDTSESETASTSIDELWSATLDENSRPMRSSIILTSINSIIACLISTFAHEQNTRLSISNLVASSKTELKWDALSLRTESIAAMSDTVRYKTLGNAMTVNVIEAIVARMIQAGCLHPEAPLPLNAVIGD